MVFLSEIVISFQLLFITLFPLLIVMNCYIALFVSWNDVLLIKMLSFRYLLKREKISNQFKNLILWISAKDVDKRMNSLRTVYRKLIYQKSGSGQDHMTLGQKKTLNMCAFLKPHLVSKKTVSNLDKPEEDEVCYQCNKNFENLLNNFIQCKKLKY